MINQNAKPPNKISKQSRTKYQSNLCFALKRHSLLFSNPNEDGTVLIDLSFLHGNLRFFDTCERESETFPLTENEFTTRGKTNHKHQCNLPSPKPAFSHWRAYFGFPILHFTCVFSSPSFSSCLYLYSCLGVHLPRLASTVSSPTFAAVSPAGLAVPATPPVSSPSTPVFPLYTLSSPPSLSAPPLPPPSSLPSTPPSPPPTSSPSPTLKTANSPSYSPASPATTLPGHNAEHSSPTSPLRLPSATTSTSSPRSDPPQAAPRP